MKIDVVITFNTARRLSRKLDKLIYTNPCYDEDGNLYTLKQPMYKAYKQADVLKWLRDEHNIHLIPVLHKNFRYSWMIYQNNIDRTSFVTDADEYEVSLEWALYNALNLI